MAYQKLEGKKNTSDMLTKAVDSDTLMRHMQALGIEFREGRNSATPAFNGCDVSTQGAEDKDEYAAEGEQARDEDDDEGFNEEEGEKGKSKKNCQKKKHPALEEPVKAASACSEQRCPRPVKAQSAGPTKSI